MLVCHTAFLLQAVVEGRFAFRTEQYDYTQHPYIMALENNPPRSWNTLPNLAQMRASYYEALAAPNMTIIGELTVAAFHECCHYFLSRLLLPFAKVALIGASGWSC